MYTSKTKTQPKNLRKDQHGIAHLGLVLLMMFVIAAVGFVAFKVGSSGKSENKDQKHEQGTTPEGGAILQTGASGCTPDALVAEAKDPFTHLPFKANEIKVVTLGKETNDSRFVYPWVNTDNGDRTNIYAPAAGKLYMIRHKVFEIDGVKSDDFDMFFAVDCKTVYRFNHITHPREDIKATYPAGELPSGDYANGGLDIPERVKPKKAITVKAGESLGYTKGTPIARNFDFAVGLSTSREGQKKAVCPFSVFSEPNKSTLLGLLGPKATYKPQAGYPCDIENKMF
ncbi:hypothetical protein EKI60_01370 [Candidatus Saccharibacteria bacterium]|nr:MAG: hypothetical protein EKI60_01370 [Candidatus Saccharibacteria bacterium]